MKNLSHLEWAQSWRFPWPGSQLLPLHLYSQPCGIHSSESDGLFLLQQAHLPNSTMIILEANNKQEAEGKELQPLEEARGTAPPRNKGLRREREVRASRKGWGRRLDWKLLVLQICSHLYDARWVF